MTEPLKTAFAAFFSRFSLRTNLVFMLLVILALVGFQRASEILAERRTAIAEAQQEILDLAHRGAGRHSDLIASAKALLQLAAGIPETSASSSTSCQTPFRNLLADLPWVTALSVVDKSGDAVCMASESRVSVNVADRPYFREAFSTRQFVVSDYLIGRASGKPIIVAAMPRVVGGEVESLVLATIDIGIFNEIVADANRRSHSEMLLTDGIGTVIAASPEPERWVGRNLSAIGDIWDRIKMEPAVFLSDSIERQRRFVSHVELEDSNAVLIVMRERADVVAAADRQATQAVVRMIVIGLLCMLVIWLGGEWLVLGPLNEMRRSASQLGAGDLDTRLRVERLVPELRHLAEAFNGMAGQLSEHDADLRQANARLEELATIDGLTGIANRRAFDERLEAEWNRARRDRRLLAVLIVDADRFKQLNDRYGHAAGDRCLQMISGALRTAARRPGDVAARIGGEEFALLLPNTDAANASVVAENLRAQIAALGIAHLDSPQGYVTVSIGVAAMRPTPNSSAADLMDAADSALYRAKRQGRDCVVRYEPPIALVS